MRLYPRQGQTSIDDPEYGHFDVNDHGGFDLPDDLSDRLHGFHVNKQPLWEDDLERQARLVREEIERRKDPATLLAAVERLEQASFVAGAASAVPPAAEPAKTPPPAKATRGRRGAHAAS